MFKKLFIVLIMLSSIVYANKNEPKQGCILAQQGEVIVKWQGKDNTTSTFKEVKYIPIRAEGINFKEILIGSKLKINRNVVLEILDIKANKRVRPNPRTGSLTIKAIVDGKRQDFFMNYTYSKNLMKATGKVDILEFNTISFDMKISAILCAIKE